jgi:histidine ammonia-lyase
LGAVLIGHQETKVVYRDGLPRPTKEVFDELGIKPLKLQPKEAMALTNGSTLMLAYSCLAVYDARDLFQIANLAVALNLEAIRGEIDAFDDRIHQARCHNGQVVAATDIRNFLEGSHRVTEEAQKVRLTPENGKDWDRPYEKRVQDAYSVRCVPQIHGTFHDALKYLETAVEVEINAATDNPLIFAREDGGYDVLSGGNFHGDPLAVPLDTLTMCLAKISLASNYRQLRLINTAFSYGLPQDLSASETTKSTGFMIAQYASVDDSLRIAQLSMPASVFNAPTSGMQEDVVSNGANAAWKNRKAIEYARNVFARELLMACQGIDLSSEKLGLELSVMGKLTEKAYRVIRKYVSMMKQDRYLHADIENVRKLIVNRLLLKGVFD